jgi:hypothetical protein
MMLGEAEGSGGINFVSARVITVGACKPLHCVVVPGLFGEGFWHTSRINPALRGHADRESRGNATSGRMRVARALPLPIWQHRMITSSVSSRGVVEMPRAAG